MISSFYVRFISRINKKTVLLHRRPKISIAIQPFCRSLCSVSENINQDTDKTTDNKNHVTFSTLSKLIKDKPDSTEITEEQVTLFLQCCGKISIYETPSTRTATLNTLWNMLETNKYQFNKEHYDVYIQTCTENRTGIDCDNFLAKMQCEPSHETYKLLLQNVCEKGDLDRAFFLLSLMKEKGYSVDEDTFSCLVLGHSIRLGLKGGENIFVMMKSAQIPVNDQAKFALIRGIIINGNLDEFKTALEKYPFELSEETFLPALEDLCFNDRHTWLLELLNITTMDSFSRQFPLRVQMLCINLIHQNKYNVPFDIYKKLVQPTSESAYAKELIKEMVKAKAPVAGIVDIVMDLKESGLNPLALENAAEIALKTEYFELAWSLFKKLTSLRPHFFWPILLNTGRKDGELGVLITLENMFSLGVKANMETFEHYCLPFCNLTEPKLLFTKLQDIGYTVKETLTPVLIALLDQEELQKAQDLCHAFNVTIFAERLISPLVGAWKKSDNIEAIVCILQKSCETTSANMQWLESFLIKIFHATTSSHDVEKLLSTLQKLKLKKLYINPTVAENLLKITNKRFLDENLFSELRDAIDALQDISITEEPAILPHPRDMDVDQLECHLLELESKNMETRGVLRKLIQLHTNAGNRERIAELRNKFVSHGYIESPGMKSSTMHRHIQSQNLPAALDLYYEIKALHPQFKMDSFKVIDLATLLIENGKTEDAVKLLINESKKGFVLGGHNIQKNCLKLLKAVKDPTELDLLFNTLVNGGYCKISNITLGPLVYIHIKRNDLVKAVQVFVDCANKHKATPFQLELLRTILRENQIELFEKAVHATQSVHGKSGAVVAVISALAEEGMQESLKKFLTRSPLLINRKMMHNRYDRWVVEGKTFPLKTLAAALRKLSIENMDLPYIYLSIMRLHSLNNDCDSALAFWEELISEGVLIPEETKTVLYNLLKKNRCDVPKSLEIQA